METYSEKKRLPEFLNEEELARFQAHPSINFFRPSVKDIKNAWLTYSGICFKPFFLFKESIYWHSYSPYRFYAQSIFNLIVKKRHFYEGSYAFIHTPWSIVNYYHWLADSMPRLLPLLDSIQDLVLLLPEKTSDVAFIQESLRLIGIKNIIYINASEVNCIERLTLVEITPGNYRLTNDLKPTVQFLKKKAGAISCMPTQRIYLTRRNMGYRTLENETEVCKLLSTYDFKIVEADRLSFIEQVKLLNETRYMVAVHGAAITNCIFMQPASSVLELHPDIDSPEKTLNVSYWNLAEHFKLNYYFLGCKSVNATERFHTANLRVDVGKMEMILKRMLSSF